MHTTSVDDRFIIMVIALAEGPIKTTHRPSQIVNSVGYPRAPSVAHDLEVCSTTGEREGH